MARIIASLALAGTVAAWPGIHARMSYSSQIKQAYV